MKPARSFLPVMIASMLIMPGLQCCKRYPDGPQFSFRSRTSRVASTWKVKSYTVNGDDYTSLVADYTETYSKDGNYSYVWGKFTGTGRWAFQNQDLEISLTGISNQSSYTMVILKMEEKEFWYYYMDGNDQKEFHMIQK